MTKPVPSSVSTPAQGATALADRIERKLKRSIETGVQPRSMITGDELTLVAAALRTTHQQAARPTCRLCGLEDGACICAHIPPKYSALRATSQTPDAAPPLGEGGLYGTFARYAERFGKQARTVEVTLTPAEICQIRDALSTPSASAEAVGWMARCPKTGGRLFAHTELTARLEGQPIYKEHGFTVEALYAHPQQQQAEGRQQDETTVLPAETIAYWFMDNHPGLDLLHADITDLIDRARIDGARQQSEGRGTVAGCAHQRQDGAK